jgi:hypothetical protein
VTGGTSPVLSEGHVNVLSMNEIEMLCRDCDAVVAFVTPDVEDAPDDLMCVLCGTAITLGGWLTPSVVELAA